jgi:uncharacterized protein (TIGR02466 family)
MEIKKNHLWPTPIWYFDIDPTQINFNKVKKEICKIKTFDKGRIASNYGGWQSNIIDIIKNTEINNLMRKIEEASELCFKDIGARTTVNKKITNYWININKKGDGNSPHIHPGCTLSGVVYVECEQDSGNITFYRDAAENYYYQELTWDQNNSVINPYQISHIYYQCIKYRVILFPSYLSHSVEANKSDKDRISIAFNFNKN